MARQVHTPPIKEPMRKVLTQCQRCFKSRLDLPEGVSLSKCGGCKIALYCSKECQKAAWKTHKETCKLNQRQYEAPPEYIDKLKMLREFSSKHRPTIAEFGIRALDLCIDPTRAMRDLVVVFLKPRADSKRTETAFVATSAMVAPLGSFSARQAEEFRGQLKYYDVEHRSKGMLGCIMVMLHDTESGLSNVCPVGFAPDIMELKPGEPWKEEMMARMNAGIVY